MVLFWFIYLQLRFKYYNLAFIRLYLYTGLLRTKLKQIINKRTHKHKQYDQVGWYDIIKTIHKKIRERSLPSQCFFVFDI